MHPPTSAMCSFALRHVSDMSYILMCGDRQEPQLSQNLYSTQNPLSGLRIDL